MKMLIFALTLLVSTNVSASGCDGQFERWEAEKVTLKAAESVWLRKKNVESLTCSWGYAEIKMKNDPKVYVAQTGWGDYCEEVKAAIQANYNHKVHLGFENVVFVAYDNCNSQMDDIGPIASGRITFTIDHGAKRFTFSYPFHDPENNRLPTF